MNQIKIMHSLAPNEEFTTYRKIIPAVTGGYYCRVLGSGPAGGIEKVLGGIVYYGPRLITVVRGKNGNR